MEDWAVLGVGVLIAACLLVLARAVMHRGCEAAEKVGAEAARQAQASAASQDTLFRQVDLVREELAKQVEGIEAHLSALYERLEQRQVAQRLADDREIAAMRAQVNAHLEDNHRALKDLRDKFANLESDLDRRFANATASVAQTVEVVRIRAGEGARVGQALAHVYWEVEALAESLRHRLASLGVTEEWEVTESEAETIRHLPPLPVDAMRQQISMLGSEPSLLLEQIADGVADLRAGRGAVSSGALRDELNRLLESVSALLSRLERMTETVGA